MDAHRYLAAARSAIEAHAYDAACANAALSAAISVRVLASRPIDLGDDARILSRANDIIDALEREGKLPPELARELRALINNSGLGLVVPAQRTDAITALAVSSHVAEIADDRADTDRSR